MERLWGVLGRLGVSVERLGEPRGVFFVNLVPFGGPWGVSGDILGPKRSSRGTPRGVLDAFWAPFSQNDGNKHVRA